MNKIIIVALILTLLRAATDKETIQQTLNGVF